MRKKNAETNAARAAARDTNRTPGPSVHEKQQKNGSFSLIERVILSAGAMLIFSVSFQIDQMPEGEENRN
jgi:hypothetical protein